MGAFMNDEAYPEWDDYGDDSWQEGESLSKHDASGSSDANNGEMYQLGTPGESRRPLRARLRPYLVGLNIALPILLVLLFVAGTKRITVPSNSMLPTLRAGQKVTVNRVAYWFGKPQRGDIVAYRLPGEPGSIFVKRVIGLPGETISIQRGYVYINGELFEEPYLTDTGITISDGSWEIPARSYFVMGDNRLHLADSRLWGPLDRKSIVGRVRAR
jgi:signal peptidase I